jgi:hypothetical protein
MATAAELRPALRVVFSYAHEDEPLRDRLAAHLASLERAHVIECWHDREIRAGDGWREEIERAIARADVILLLISPDFVASDYCFTIEMANALKRHAAGTALVVPILLRALVTAGQPWSELQSLPRDLRAVTSWPNLDEAFADVARGLLDALEAWRPALPSPGTRSPADREPLAKDRVFDAAVPSHVQVGQSSEIVSLVRTPDSGGLRAILAADDSFAARPEGVRSQELSLDFLRDEHGRPLPLRLTLVLESPDFDPPRQTKRIQVPPEGDSATYVFLAVPRRAGLLALELELLSGDVSIVSHLLRSRADEDLRETARRYVVATLPLTTTGVRAALEDTLAPVPMPSPSSTGAFRPVPPAAARPSPPRTPASKPRSVGIPALGALAAAVLVSTSAWLVLQQRSPSDLPSPRPTNAPVPTMTPMVFTTPTPAPADATAVLAQARRLYERHDYAAVVALVDRTEAKTPQLHELAGRSLYEMGRYRQAEARFKLASDADPTNAERLALLKRAHQAAGHEQRSAH